MSSIAVTTTTTSASSPPSSSDVFDITHTKVPTKAPSTSALPTIRPSSSIGNFLADEMSTLPDPRNRAVSPVPNGTTPATPSDQPDLNEEVTALSTKLINAINHQTHLDDTLSATRHELESANDRIAELENQIASQREILTGDVWVRRSAVDTEKKTWQASLAEEKAKRLDTERAKKKIEQELENLTAALFEEANKMVIRAKEEAQAEHDALQRKNDQVKAQLADSEGLLRSQQEQLSELKHVLETMSSDRDDQTNTNLTAPSSPGLTKFDTRDDDGFGSDVTVASPNSHGANPANPTSFSHLIQPVLRHDLAMYDDFVSLAKLARQRTGSRDSSSSLGRIGLPSLGLGGNPSSTHPSNGSVSSLNTTGYAATSSAPQSPNTPASGFSASSPTPAALTSLRDTKFFKRVLAEDIEPTLRLDAAPGLSWLARRSVLSAITDGSLVVDPVTTHAGNSFIMSIAKPQFNPCSLCGESRKDEIYLRNHRFRTSEQDSAQRYPLCGYCLGRVRSTCDILSFLRMIKDGHWRADDDDQEKAAWEESVRLREQMFWARIGGGVVPCGHIGLAGEIENRRRPSQEQTKSDSAPVEKPTASEDTPVSPEQEQPVPGAETIEATEITVADDLSTPLKQSEDPKEGIRDSTQTLTVQSDAGSEYSKRLSITIPSKE
ncbi:rab guanine nucleotide exchange factor S2 [Amphichorda felina]